MKRLKLRTYFRKMPKVDFNKTMNVTNEENVY